MNGKVEYRVIAYGHDGSALEDRWFDNPNIAAYRAQCYIVDASVGEVKITKEVKVC